MSANYAYDVVPPEYALSEPSEHTCSFCGETMAIEDYDAHECAVEAEREDRR